TLGEMLKPGRYKTQAIRHTQEVVPHILIGIGDKETDADAYGGRGMLAIVLAKGDPSGFRSHAVILPDWKEIGVFFKSNLETLKDPERLERVMKDRGQLLRPIIPWQPAKKRAPARDAQPVQAPTDS